MQRLKDSIRGAGEAALPAAPCFADVLITDEFADVLSNQRDISIVDLFATRNQSPDLDEENRRPGR
jgi:hypothetical protein